MIQITQQPIDPQAVLDAVATPRAGAVVLFLGTTRQFTGQRETASLDYECHEAMALAKLHELALEAGRRWPLLGCAIVHRVGSVDIGQTSVAVAVSSAHRHTAFEAGEWLIDTLKQVVPIWKKELWTDGTSEWVHPGLTLNQDESAS